MPPPNSPSRPPGEGELPPVDQPFLSDADTQNPTVSSPVLDPVTEGLPSSLTELAAGASTRPSSIYQLFMDMFSSRSSPIERSQDGGAIIITVSYVFSDENDPDLPNRSGSLVMSLPNTPQNREPDTIQEIIALATQVAYLTILNGFKKTQNVTLDKFNLFPTPSLDLLSDHTCSICFEDYDVPESPKLPEGSEAVDSKGSARLSSKRNSSKDDVVSLQAPSDRPAKRRKLLAGQTIDTTTNSAELSAERPMAERVAQLRRESSSGTSEGDRPTLTARTPSSAAAQTPSDSAQSQANSQSPRKVFLSESKAPEIHTPMEMPCGHIFGKSCLFEWLKDHTSCPLCRASVAETVTAGSGVSGGSQLGEGLPTNFINLADTRNWPVGTNMTQNSANRLLLMFSASPTAPDAAGVAATPRPSLGDDLPLRIGGLGPVLHAPPTFNPPSTTGTGTTANWRRLYSRMPTGIHSATTPRSNPLSSTTSTASTTSDGVLSLIFSFLRRQNDVGESILPSGVSSRRTQDGVESRQLNWDEFGENLGISGRSERSNVLERVPGSTESNQNEGADFGEGSAGLE